MAWTPPLVARYCAATCPLPIRSVSGVPRVSQWSSFNRIRTAIGAVGLVVVLSVGVVVLAVPRPAGGAPARAASPVQAFAAEREAVSGPIRTILRLRLPRGLYAVNAKVVLIDRETNSGRPIRLAASWPSMERQSITPGRQPRIACPRATRCTPSSSLDGCEVDSASFAPPRTPEQPNRPKSLRSG